MRTLIRFLSIVAFLTVATGCTDPNGDPQTGLNVQAVTQAPQQEITVAFSNPAFMGAWNPGGGIPVGPVGVQLPQNVSSFFVRFDSSLHLTPQDATNLNNGAGGMDSTFYNLRLCSLIVTTPTADPNKPVVYGLDPATNKYTVPKGALVNIWAVWQVVEVSRDIPEGVMYVPAQVAF